MHDFKEFQGKSLDEAIETACDFFNLERGKLEIEILSGGSTGIFGLMGVKKATVKARPRPGLKQALSDIPEERDEMKTEMSAAPEYENESHDKDDSRYEDEDEQEYKDEEDEEKAEENHGGEEDVDEEVLEAERDYERARLARQQPDSRGSRQQAEPKGNRQQRGTNRPEGNRSRNRFETRNNRPAERRYERKPQAERQAPDNGSAPDVYDGPDPVLVEETVREVLTHLLKPITGEEPELSFTREAGRFDVFIDDDENSGLIIGREGQTLSALQYLTNRIVSRKLEAPVRIQIDTGDYRERQNENLRRLALQLADKAKNIGRTQSTRPLSSYHRRVVHMALQNDSGIQTRSKGDGPLKKVLILPNRRRNGGGGGGGRSHHRNPGNSNREYQHRDRW